MTTKTKRTSIDFSKAIASLDKSASEGVNNRFAQAASIIAQFPTGLSSGSEAPTQHLGIGTLIAATRGVQDYEIGKTYAVPLKLIDPNPVGVRHFYRGDDVEGILKTMTGDGQQDVAANGFVKNGRVELFDGGTRLRAARAAGYETLDVKIEPAPATLRDQFKRSARLNENRTAHTALDLAVNFKRLIDEGVYDTQDALAADMEEMTGKALLKSQVSQYMRIARIPMRFLELMKDKESTSNVSQAYFISGLFESETYLAEPKVHEQTIRDIISKIGTDNLSKEQTVALISASFAKKKERERAASTEIKYGKQAGMFKVFPLKGQVVFSIQGLDQSDIDDIKERITQALAGASTST